MTSTLMVVMVIHDCDNFVIIGGQDDHSIGGGHDLHW